jgi:hypothetical protein
MTATLFIGPFAAAESGAVRGLRLHPLVAEEELAEFAVRYTALRSPVHRDLEYLARYLDRVQPPPRNEDHRLQQLLLLREKAQKTNRVYAASVGMGVGIAFGVVWFLGFSFFATWAADLMARSRRGWYGRWEVYGAAYGAGMILTVSSALFFFVVVTIESGPGGRPMWEHLLPGYLAVSGLCVIYLWGVNRAVARDWKWWAFELFSLGWLLASAGVLAAVGYFLM